MSIFFEYTDKYPKAKEEIRKGIERANREFRRSLVNKFAEVENRRIFAT